MDLVINTVEDKVLNKILEWFRTRKKWVKWVQMDRSTRHVRYFITCHKQIIN